MGLLPMKETIMEFKCWLWLVLSGGNPPLTPGFFFSIFFVRCILSMCFPKKRHSEVLEGPQISRYLRPWYLCALNAARSGDFNICERVSYLSTLWHVQNHPQVHLSCTWTGIEHPSAISDFFLFGNFLPNFNLENLIWNLHKEFFHEINYQNLLLIKNEQVRLGMELLRWQLAYPWNWHSRVITFCVKQFVLWLLGCGDPVCFFICWWNLAKLYKTKCTHPKEKKEGTTRESTNIQQRDSTQRCKCKFVCYVKWQ